MTSPSEIAALAVREELYARAAFARLIALPVARFRAEVEADPLAQTEFMAAQIVDHYEANYLTIPPESAVDLLLSAQVAAREGEPHARFRVAKNLANALRSDEQHAEAQTVLTSAEELANQTLARGVHGWMIEFTRLPLLWSIGRQDEASDAGEAAIQAFEENGAPDRAYMVRLYDAWTKSVSGQHLAALGAYGDAARRARAVGSQELLGHAYENMGHCYRGLEEFGLARRYFARSARTYRKMGDALLEARTLRCTARMSIQLIGEAAIHQMDSAKSVFLRAGAAGEVCRASVAVMEELLLRDPTCDLTAYCRDLTEEAMTLGILKQVEPALARLDEAARNRQMSDQLLSDTWDAFGLTPWHPGISAMVTVSN